MTASNKHQDERTPLLRQGDEFLGPEILSEGSASDGIALGRNAGWSALDLGGTFSYFLNSRAGRDIRQRSKD